MEFVVKDEVTSHMEEEEEDVEVEEGGEMGPPSVLVAVDAKVKWDVIGLCQIIYIICMM